MCTPARGSESGSGGGACGRLIEELRKQQGILTHHLRQGILSDVRIGKPALKHGIPEADALHAVRNAMRRIVMDEDLTMLIGPAVDGRLLESASWGWTAMTPSCSTRWPCDRSSASSSDEGMTCMARHTDPEVERAAERFARLADELDPTVVEAHSTDDLRQVAAASDAVRADEVRLRDAVRSARERGRSWNQIAVALGVSRQAARQRFADKANA